MSVDYVEYHGIGRKLTLSAPLSQMSVASRRTLFSELFRDPEVCPGQKTMSPEDSNQAQKAIGRWCGWAGG